MHLIYTYIDNYTADPSLTPNNHTTKPVPNLTIPYYNPIEAKVF